MNRCDSRDTTMRACVSGEEAGVVWCAQCKRDASPHPAESDFALWVVAAEVVLMHDCLMNVRRGAGGGGKVVEEKRHVIN